MIAKITNISIKLILIVESTWVLEVFCSTIQGVSVFWCRENFYFSESNFEYKLAAQWKELCTSHKQAHRPHPSSHLSSDGDTQVLAFDKVFHEKGF